jgi:crotonobetainyl-CoA:carnitine CoA-transferase CaiB-like acyl-CoA transferase
MSDHPLPPVPPGPQVSPAPLSRYTVLDLTIARAGPTAVRLLADWGARVIRVESIPRRGAGGLASRHSPDEQNLHRNKRSLCLDLKQPRGMSLFRDLVTRADVVVENFRPDVKARLGIDYPRLKAMNPRIILASVSGFGQDGPYRARPGVDQVIQGMSGLMSVTGEPGRGPMRVGIAVSDTAAGMFLGQGILLALLHREQTGEGQWVHTSLLESMLNKLDFQAARYTVGREVPEQQGNFHPTMVPMGAFETRDGLVNVAAVGDRAWTHLCEALDAGHLLRDPDYADGRARVRNQSLLNAALAERIRGFATADLVERLNAAGVPCGPILDIGQAFEDPQARHLRMTRPAEHARLGRIELLRSPINLSRFPHPDGFACAAPDPGEHTDALLEELGCDRATIDELRKEGVVA